jgi:hypothetical protein
MIFSDLICLLRSVRKNDFFLEFARMAQSFFPIERIHKKTHTYLCVNLCVKT